MTAQIPDSFLSKAKKFSVVGVNGGRLFNPVDHNMQPLPRITSCWRGYVCTYKIPHNKLVPDVLPVNLGSEGPAIHHVHPVFSNPGMFDHTYHSPDLPMDIAGELLVYGLFDENN